MSYYGTCDQSFDIHGCIFSSGSRGGKGGNHQGEGERAARGDCRLTGLWNAYPDFHVCYATWRVTASVAGDGCEETFYSSARFKLQFRLDLPRHLDVP